MKLHMLQFVLVVHGEKECMVLSAFWVNPDQVKKSAPLKASGEFLPKGSFTIEGQRNFIKSRNLKLAVGIIPQDEDYVITCGPPRNN